MNASAIAGTDWAPEARKIQTDYELSEAFDADWRLGWE